MSTCRSCGAPVLFARAVSGSWMILDAEPREDGNVVLVLRRPSDYPVQSTTYEAHVYRDAEAAGAAHPHAPRYLDHHATCPDRDRWSRTGARR